MAIPWTIIGLASTVPRLVLVETNMMSWPIDSVLVEQFGKNDAEPYRWFRPVRAAISSIYYWIKFKSEAENVKQLPRHAPTDYDISASVAAALDDRRNNYDDAMKRNTTTLKHLVANLEARGYKIFFYELPYPDPLNNTDFAATARTLTHAAFPDPQKWLTLDYQEWQLRWVDAAHMDERSAIIVAQHIEKLLQRINSVN